MIQKKLNTTNMAKLYLLNDDNNDFDFVIKSLTTVLHKNPLTANQLAILAHYKKKIVVKEGDFMELLEYQDKFNQLNILTQVENY